MQIIPIFRGATLSQMAEFTAVVSTCAILIGLSYKLGFYQAAEVDAVWFIPLFSPSDLLMAGLEVYVYYIIAALYMTKVLSTKDEEKGAEIISQIVLLIVIGISFYFVYDTPISVFGYIFSSFIAFYLILFRENVGKFVGVMIMFFIPWFMGSNTFKSNIEQSIPKVVLENDTTNKSWLLLDKYSDKAVLISKESSRTNFKIVNFTDIKYIENINN